LDSRAVLDFFHRVVEPLALQALGDETLHASAVSLASGVVGFCGDCESGKSTIAYGLSRRGYRQLADDSLVLQFGHQGVRARELPFGVRLRPQSAAFFGVGSGATQIRATGASAAATVSTQPLSALFILSRTSAGQPVAEQLPALAAYQALLPFARCFDAKDREVRRRVLQHYLELVAVIPVFTLKYASGLESLPAVFDCVERAVGPVKPVKPVKHVESVESVEPVEPVEVEVA
ncbi:MAG: hypothetical protein AB7F99_19230, partial [Vicinamibacterales bacterium]